MFVSEPDELADEFELLSLGEAGERCGVGADEAILSSTDFCCARLCLKIKTLN